MSRRRRGGPQYAYPANMQRNPQAQPARTQAEIVRGQALDLGDLGGDSVEPVLATFTWFGESFRVNPDMTETTLIDLFEMASAVDVDPESLDPKQMKFAKDYVREHIHPDDFERLWQVGKEHRQGIQRLMQLCMRVLTLVSERPTVPPSGSSDGRPVINQSLPDGASPQAVRARNRAEFGEHADWWPDGVPYNPTAVKFVEQFQEDGRPDKANIIMMAQEARARAAASAVLTG